MQNPHSAEKLELDPLLFCEAVETFNAAVADDNREFDPNVKDGRSTAGVRPRKSNWALKIDEPPFLGFPVTAGITFTFGGLRINTSGEVLSENGRAVAGLFGAGELVGGLFYHNYPSGTGLSSGTVFGRRAGENAAAFANQQKIAVS